MIAQSESFAQSSKAWKGLYHDLDAYDQFYNERDYKQKVEEYNSRPDKIKLHGLARESNEAEPGTKRDLYSSTFCL